MRSDFAAARSLYASCLAQCRRQGNKYGISSALLALARVSRLAGDTANASAYYSEEIAFNRGAGTEDSDSFLGLAYLKHAQGENEEGVQLLRHALMLYQEPGDEGGIAACLVLMAEMKRTAQRPREAAQLLGTANAQLGRMGGKPYLHDQHDWDRCLKAVRAELSANEFDAAWTAGERMDLSEALELAFRSGEAEPAAQTSMLTPLRAMKAQYGGLTTRERDVAACVARGLSNRAIAEDLVLSERTVEAHIGNILGKLELSSRTQIATWVLEKGLVVAGRSGTAA
jgi:DNA-binding CsgD family transcriptional regulator